MLHGRCNAVISLIFSDSSQGVGVRRQLDFLSNNKEEPSKAESEEKNLTLGQPHASRKVQRCDFFNFPI